MALEPELERVLKNLDELAAARRRRTRLIWIGTALMVGLIMLMIAGLFRVQSLSSKVADNQRENTQALCAFRNDLRERINSAEKFLRQHPQGAFGISADTIEMGVQDELSTIQALAVVRCS